MKLPEFLDEYKEWPALFMHWVVVGPGMGTGTDLREHRPSRGGVLRHYDHCMLAHKVRSGRVLCHAA